MQDEVIIPPLKVIDDTGKLCSAQSCRTKKHSLLLLSEHDIKTLLPKEISSNGSLFTCLSNVRRLFPPLLNATLFSDGVRTVITRPPYDTATRKDVGSTYKKVLYRSLIVRTILIGPQISHLK